jgi:hypothetical protein
MVVVVRKKKTKTLNTSREMARVFHGFSSSTTEG